MTSPISSSISIKASSAFSSRKVESICPKLNDELSGHICNIPLHCFFEHVLAAPEAVTNQWDSTLHRWETDLIARTLRGTFTRPVTREPDSYEPFAALANFILERARHDLDPRQGVVPDLLFAASGSRILKGDAQTPKRKPDVVLVEKSIATQLEQQPDTDVNWSQVLVAFEFKVAKKKTSAVTPSPGSSTTPSSPMTPMTPVHSSPGKRKAELITTSRKKTRGPHSKLLNKDHIQLADYAHEMLSSTNGTRKHAIVIFVKDNLLQPWYYDCGGGVCTDWIDINEDFMTFMTFIVAITRLQLIEYGFFSIFDWPPAGIVPYTLAGASLTLPGLPSSNSPEGAHRVTFTSPISARAGIVTRAALVWGAICDTLAGELVVKISFQQVARKNEVDIIKYAERCGVHHLPVVFAWKDFDKISDGIRSRLPEDTSVKFDDRVLRVIVLKRYTPVYRICSTLSEFKVVIRDVFDCMVQLHQKAGILHRDISCDNLMAEKIDGSWHGILNDFDLAIKNDVPHPDPLEHTGTLPFMAVDLLLNSAQPHLFRHDAESLFYVLVWIAVHYDAQGEFVQPEELSAWKAETCKDMLAKKDSFWQRPMENLNLTNFYEGLRRTWIMPLSLLYIQLRKTSRQPVDEEDKVILHRAKSMTDDLSWLDTAMEEQQTMSDESLIKSIQAFLDL